MKKVAYYGAKVELKLTGRPSHRTKMSKCKRGSNLDDRAVQRFDRLQGGQCQVQRFLAESATGFGDDQRGEQFRWSALSTLRHLGTICGGRDIALESVAPLVVQTSITTAIYQTTLQDNVALKYSETVLL